MNYRIFPLGNDALTVELGNEISGEMHGEVVRLADFFERNSFFGLVEIVPAYASLTVFYNAAIVGKNFPEFATAFAAVKNFTENALQNLSGTTEINSRLVEIPVCFNKELALDLEFVAQVNSLESAAVVEIFLTRIYRVFMLGFLPGFAYLGEVDERIAAPRKDSPRLQVPKGSVGIAGRQTGIYPLESPGGWQIIGGTNYEMFTPNAESPTFLRVGDSVKFYRAEF